MSKSELRQSFDYFDLDHNGAIDFDEFCNLLDALKSDGDEESRRMGFDLIDLDRNGTIDFEEFSAWWHEQD